MCQLSIIVGVLWEYVFNFVRIFTISCTTDEADQSDNVVPSRPVRGHDVAVIKHICFFF